MRIVIIGPAYPYRGGLAAFGERMALALMDMGHDVRIETFKRQYPGLLFPGKTQYRDSPADARLEIKRSIDSISPLNWWRLGKRIAAEAPDLVIMRFWLPFMGPAFGSIARQIKKNRQTKVICLVDNIIPHESRIGDGPFTRYFCKAMDAYLCMSDGVLQDVSKFDTAAPRLLSPHPIFDHFGEKLSREEALSALGLNSNHRYMLFFGFVRAYKGLDILIEAMQDKRIKKSQLKLIVAGEYYDDKRKYTEQIKQAGLDDQILIHDRFIPDDEVAHYFCAADFVVQPYHRATQSGVTQIAYHFEVPMIVTDVGGLAEMCPDGKVGRVVEAQAPALADAINHMQSEEALDQYRAGVRNEKQKYSWEVFGEALISLARQLDEGA